MGKFYDTNCKFNDGQTGCLALDSKMCKGCYNCSFKKTRQEFAESRKKSAERLASLPYETRKHIEEKYGIHLQVCANGSVDIAED